MIESLEFLWSGEDFKTKDYYLPTDTHIIRMTYGEAKLLYKYCQAAEKGIIEIGRYFGGSTYFAVVASKDSIPVLSVDIRNNIKIYNSKEEMKGIPMEEVMKDVYLSEDYKKVVKHLIAAQNNQKLTLLNVDSKDMKLTKEYDVAWIDGDHSYKGVKNDVEKSINPSLKYLVFHDYEEPTTPGVTKYVNELISKGICKKLEQTHTMIALEYLKNS